MKRLLVCSLIGLASSAPVPAQPKIGVYFDAAGTMTTQMAIGFGVYSVYVIAKDLEGVDQLEFALELSDPTWQLLEAALLPVGAQDLAAGDQQWLVALSNCSVQSSLAVVEYKIGYFLGTVAPNDVELCVVGAEADVSGLGGLPGYRTCAGEWAALARDPFSEPDPGRICAFLNPSIRCDLVRYLDVEAPQVAPARGVEFDFELEWRGRFEGSNEDCIDMIPLPIGYSIRVQWDPAVAELVEVLPPADLPEAQVQWSGAPGNLFLEASVLPYGDPGYWQSAKLAVLRLRAAAQAASTDVLLSEFDYLGGCGIEPDVQTLHDGSIQVGSVAVTEQSFGAVKARY